MSDRKLSVPPVQSDAAALYDEKDLFGVARPLRLLKVCGSFKSEELAHLYVSCGVLVLEDYAELPLPFTCRSSATP
jgi:hypothetical protein